MSLGATRAISFLNRGKVMASVKENNSSAASFDRRNWEGELIYCIAEASAEPSGVKKDQTAKFALRAPLHLPHFPATSALATLLV